MQINAATHQKNILKKEFKSDHGQKRGWQTVARFSYLQKSFKMLKK